MGLFALRPCTGDIFHPSSALASLLGRPVAALDGVPLPGLVDEEDREECQVREGRGGEGWGGRANSNVAKGSTPGYCGTVN